MACLMNVASGLGATGRSTKHFTNAARRSSTTSTRRLSTRAARGRSHLVCKGATTDRTWHRLSCSDVVALHHTRIIVEDPARELVLETARHSEAAVLTYSQSYNSRDPSSRASAPTSAPPDVRPERHMHTCSGSIGSRALAPTLEPRPARPERPKHTCSRSTNDYCASVRVRVS